MFCNICSMVTGRTVFAPCAPYAFVKLLFCGEIAIEGENVVIVGADNIAGEPKAPMLMSCSTTFLVCSIKARDLVRCAILAEILIVATGVPFLINQAMDKRG